MPTVGTICIYTLGSRRNRDERTTLETQRGRPRRRCHHGRMVERALSFGSVAAAYEQFRPGYPDELVEQILTYAGRPVRTALEIGAGTGKATRVLARRAIAVTATDPDAAMLAELRQHVPATVNIVQSAFEDLALTTTYDLVYAAASLHWTDPTGRWSRVAALLETGGTFAAFGAERDLADPALDEAVHAVRRQYLADDDVPWMKNRPADGSMAWPGTELEQSGLFIDVRQSVIEGSMTTSARDFVGHLSTVSAYLQLPAPVREQALNRILAVLPEQVRMRADLVIHLARKA
jgi:SAM-dependent methyltransferase